MVGLVKVVGIGSNTLLSMIMWSKIVVSRGCISQYLGLLCKVSVCLWFHFSKCKGPRKVRIEATHGEFIEVSMTVYLIISVLKPIRYFFDKIQYQVLEALFTSG